MRFRICHDDVRYDIVSSNSVHRCRVCGRRFLCVVSDFRKGDYSPPRWAEIFSWTRFWNGRAA